MVSSGKLIGKFTLFAPGCRWPLQLTLRVVFCSTVARKVAESASNGKRQTAIISECLETQNH